MYFRSFFTLEEAEALIPHLRPLVARAMEIVHNIQRQEEKIDLSGVRDADEEVELVQLVRTIESWGCQIQQLEDGVIEFPTSLQGHPVFFSWYVNEEGILYYSEPEAEGLRRRLPQPISMPAPPN